LSLGSKAKNGLANEQEGASQYYESQASNKQKKKKGLALNEEERTRTQEQMEDRVFQDANKIG
jgi:hypothetical protein